MHLSSQMSKISREPLNSHGVPEKVYVLVRVTSVSPRGNGTIQYIPDPWKKLHEGRLCHAKHATLQLVPEDTNSALDSRT